MSPVSAQPWPRGGTFSWEPAPSWARLENEVAMLPHDTWFTCCGRTFQMLSLPEGVVNIMSCFEVYPVNSGWLRVSGRLWSRSGVQSIPVAMLHCGFTPQSQGIRASVWGRLLKMFFSQTYQKLGELISSCMALNNMGIWPCGSERLFPAGYVLELTQFSCIFEWDAINMYWLFT